MTIRQRLRAPAFAVAAAGVLFTATPPVETAHTNPAVVATIPVGNQPLAVAVNEITNRVYVTNRLDDTVSVIDAAARTVVASIPVGDEPWGVDVNPATNRVYVASAQGGSTFGASVSVIDGATNGVIATIPISDWSVRGVAANPDTNRIYVSGCCFRGIRVVDGATNEVVDTVSLPSRPETIGAMTVNPVTNRIYVPDARSSDGHVFVVDGNTHTFVTAIPMPEPFDSSPNSLAFNTATDRIYGAQSFDDVSTIVDAATNAVGVSIAVGSSPIAAGANAKTNRIYIANFGDGTVSVIDGFTETVVATVAAGSSPRGIAVHEDDDLVYVADASEDLVAVIANCVDSDPPTLAVSLTPDILSPPDRSMRAIGAEITVSDDCDARPAVRLTDVVISGPDIPNPPEGPLAGDDVQGAEFGTDDRAFQLRAEPDGDGTSRTYTVTYEAEDASGKTIVKSVEVTVVASQNGGP